MDPDLRSASKAAACIAKALESAPWADDLARVVKLDLKTPAAGK